MKKCSMSKHVWIVLQAGFVLLTVQSLLYAAPPEAATSSKPQSVAPGQAAAAAQSAKLLNDDCIKCHSKAPTDIAAAGTKHKSEIGCQDCHNGHPPTTRKIIPLCSQCHEGKPHYKLDVCKNCHFNPHMPLNIKMGGNITDPCLTCHTQQIVKLRDNKSKHTLLYCSSCHNTHGKIPDCTQCHKSHSAEQTNADCKKCHQAHMPKNIAYNDKTPSKDCAACHKAAYTLLSASTFKHKSLSCVACHQAKHKMVPECQSCHGTPHPAPMLAKFPKCGFCHSIAHDLNNYKDPKSTDSSTTTDPAKKQPKKK
ncbi:MAG: cytochrome c3 family protein [Desulfuromonadales bacterium]